MRRCVWVLLLAFGVSVAGREAERPAPKKDTHWSLKPLQATTVPAGARHPVDAFIRATLASRGLSHSAKADRRVLIRRLTFDLHGLPPTPSEVDTFLNDPAPNAYEKLVDRLLASPRYGERWARHWMDIAHFAETHGHDQDAVREHAWPYRDYLIRSFNEDKPYAQFLQEQVAADVLFPHDPQAIPALGFLAAGPWDESSQKDIRDDTIDKKQAQYIDRDDMLTTVFTAFASTSVHCARCHDHKFDPITINEYYNLQAVFAGVERANRPYEPDPVLAKRRVALQQQLATIKARTFDLAKTAPLVAVWEERFKKRDRMWSVLTLEAQAKSSKPEVMKDGSVRFGGPRPEKDTYTLTTTVPDRTTALRLEVLTDETLPHRGPGRQDNGNLHLSEVRIVAGADGASAKPVAISAAIADFDQMGWDITRAIDGKPETAWGIYPAVGQPHEAVFRLKESIPAGHQVTITLDQLHGGGHLIGRLRLTATNAVDAGIGGLVVPMGVAQVLSVPVLQRTPAQHMELAAHVLKEETEAELAALPKAPMVYAGANQFTPLGNFSPPKEPRAVHVLRRGEITRPGALAKPGTLSMVPGVSANLNLADEKDEGARRAALAKWFIHRDNGLVWRSIVNRTWHHHFGRGIVATPNDFGLMGAEPTHSELLDWLAIWFRDGGGSLKALHRLLVTSETYQQVSDHRPAMAAVDEGNAYLWRANRQRLEAEAIRDSILHASGTLDERMGGPSDRHFILSPGIHVTPNVDYNKFDVDSPTARRRSVYRFVFRTLPDPLLEALDCPDASLFTPVRNNSVTALQALALLNDRFTVRYAEHLASRLLREANTLDEQIALAYRLTLSRPATDAERQRLRTFAAEHGLANACRVLFNCNEFLFVD